MKALYIDGRRNGYAPCQCGRTMTIGELIEFLQEFDEDSGELVDAEDEEELDEGFDEDFDEVLDSDSFDI